MSSNDSFNIMEGACPECQEELELTVASGTQWFIDNYSDKLNLGSVIMLTPWEDNEKGFREDFREEGKPEGEVEFICENGHKFTAKVNSHGDWSTS